MKRLTLIDPEGDALIIVKYTPDSESKDGPQANAQAESENFFFLVSTKHLTLSSAYFKARLSPSWGADVVRPDGGRLQIEMDEFNPEAVNTVLLCIHCQYDKIAGLRFSPKVLSNVLLFADYIQCLDGIRPLIVNLTLLEGLAHGTYSLDDTTRYIWLAYTMKREIDFYNLTVSLIRRLSNPIDRPSIPIPKAIFDQIDKDRTVAIGKIFEIAPDRSALYRDCIRCCKTCQLAISGWFVSRLAINGIDCYAPAPYHGISIESIAKAFESVDQPNMHWMCERRRRVTKKWAISLINSHIRIHVHLFPGLYLSKFPSK